jgi:hypothetical protein
MTIMRQLIITGFVGASGVLGVTAVLAQEPASLALLQSRYQVTQMERVLGGAAEHGAKIARERLRAMIPADMLLTENVRVRGFPLEGYGVFFDVEMPPLEGTVLSIFQTLDQNNLGLESALREITAFIESAGNTNLRQAWQRVELHLDPLSGQSGAAGSQPADSRALTTGSAAALTPDAPGSKSPVTAKRDAMLGNPQEAFRSEVREALIDAMLDHSSALHLADAEWLTVAARGTEDRPRLNPGDYESPIIQISVRGSDLTAFQAKQISRDDARKRFLVKVF